MAKLPMLRAHELIKVLGRLGFEIVRQKGSHAFLRNKEGKTTIIPVHPTEAIDRGLLNKIIKKDLGISREEFMKYL